MYKAKRPYIRQKKPACMQLKVGIASVRCLGHLDLRVPFARLVDDVDYRVGRGPRPAYFTVIFENEPIVLGSLRKMTRRISEPMTAPHPVGLMFIMLQT